MGTGGRTIEGGLSFDSQSGLWSSISFCQYTVGLDLYEAGLISSTRLWCKFVNEENFKDGSGVHRGPDLIPSLPNDPCPCGFHFIDKNFPEG